jgi:phage shock protein A
MDELMATPPAPPTSHRFAVALERYHHHMEKLEKAVAGGRPKFLAQAELYLDDLRREVEAARVAADRWEDWARQAVLDQRDDLAKEALRIRDQWHRQAGAWQVQLEELRRAI